MWQNKNLFLTRWLKRKYKGLAGHETRAAEMLKTMPDDAVSWDCIPATILFRLVIRASPAACAVFLVASLVGNGRVRG